MKTVIFAFVSLTFTASALACSCSKYVLDHDVVIQKVVEKKFGRPVVIDDITHIKSCPTLIEKLDLLKFKNTSCEVRGPQNEFLYYCIDRVKNDYEVKAENCTFIIQAKSTYKTAKAKIKKTNCQ